MPSDHGISMPPPGMMDGRAAAHGSGGSGSNGIGGQDDRGRGAVSAPASATTKNSSGLEWPQSPTTTSSSEVSSRSRLERASASNLRGAAASSAAAAKPPPTATTTKMQGTIRAVTPEPADPDVAAPISAAAGVRGYGSPQTSPRSIPGGPVRRQGMVFNESYSGSPDGPTATPPLPRQTGFRPRTHTMDGAMRQQKPSGGGGGPGGGGGGADSRHRVGSFSSSGSTPMHHHHEPREREEKRAHAPPPLSMPASFSQSQHQLQLQLQHQLQHQHHNHAHAHVHAAHPHLHTPSRAAPPPDLHLSTPTGTSATAMATATSTPTPGSAREKKSGRGRLIKRQSSSRPTSPLVSAPPSIDSLPLPVPTDDANKVLLLMRTLCGRMRGEVEYRSDPSSGGGGGEWYAGICYIDEDKGALMFDSGPDGPFHCVLLPDLRGCRVLPVRIADPSGGPTRRGLEIAVVHPAPVELLVRPLAGEEADLWLAALLCWQQLRPGSVRITNGTKSAANREASASGAAAAAAAAGGGGATPTRPEMRRQGSSNGPPSSLNIIKVGKVMLWDKGLATSPRAIVKRPSTRDLRSPTTSWRRVSCILQGNGEFRLLTESDSTVLSVIELSQLSRCAVQRLDRTVLDEEFCIAIFPIYSSRATQLSIFRPVYIALDSRVQFEVWYVLLRAFAVPDIYRLEGPEQQVAEITELDREFDDDEVFRVEKTIYVRATEAKIKPRSPSATDVALPPSERHLMKKDHNNNNHSKDGGGGGGGGKNDDQTGNYLAEVILDGEVRARTTTQQNTKNPFWREECEFRDLPAPLPFLSIIVKRVDGNLETLGHQLQASLGLPKTGGNLTEVMCGSVDIPLDQLEKGRDHDQWLQILDERQQSIGTMLVRIRHDEHVILLAKEYQPLSDLLHRFPAGLTTQVSAVLPGNLRRLAEIFLNIFQVSGSVGEWLMALVEDEIDGIGNQASLTKKYRFSSRLKSNESIESGSDREQMVRDMSKSLAGEANLLFRGNSLLTHALESHMRRLGREYLVEVLAEKISEINEINPDCEVDPSRVRNGEDLQQHWSRLVHLTTEVWQCIAESADRVPSELRHILKYIRAVAEDRYGDFLRTVKYTSVSGFLFLRFICPAILGPKLFGLLRDHPRPQAQRTFTLVAKSLQVLANLSSFGKKEDFMEPMNRFLNHHRQGVKDYIDQVCAIPADKAVDRGGLVLPASYSTPVAILGRLSPTAREGFPSLPYLIDHARNFAGLVKLWTDTNPLGGGIGGGSNGGGGGGGAGGNIRTGSRGSGSGASGPTSVGGDLLQQANVDGDLLIFNELCIGLQRRADECYARVEAGRLLAENAGSSLTTTADDLVEQLEQASLLESLNLSGANSSSWTESDNMLLRPPGSSGSDGDNSNVAGGAGDERRSRDHRRGRQSSSMRHASGQSEGGASSSGGGGSQHGTLRTSRNGRSTRNILSGLMRMGRSDSPDGGPGGASRAGKWAAGL